MAGLKYKASDGTYKPLTIYNVTTPDVVQTTGTGEGSEKAVMSQSAVTTEFQKYVTSEGLNTTLEGYATTGTVDTLNTTVNSHVGNDSIHVNAEQVSAIAAVSSKANASDLNAHTANTIVHVTAEDKVAWNKVADKADATALTTHTDDLDIHVTTGDKDAWNAKAEVSAVTTVSNALTAHTTNNDIHVTAEKKDAWDAKAEVSDVTAVSDALTAHTADTTAHITDDERTKWNAVTGKANTDDVYSKTDADAKFQALGNYVSATTLDNYSTTAQVEEKITAAVSVKADSSTVTSINDTLTAHTNNADIHVTTNDKATWNAVTGKADSSTVTSINNVLTAHTNNADVHVTTGDKATWNTVTAKANSSDFTAHTANTTVHITDGERNKWNAKAEVSAIPTNVSQLTNDSSFIRSAQYDSAAKAIKFYDIASSAITTATTAVATVDATAFIKDGMVSSASVSNGNLVITFNADAGKENISIPITDIFNASNYYTTADTYSKTEVNSMLAGKSNTGHTHAISDVTNLQSALDGKSNTGHVHEISGVTGLQAALNSKSNTGHTHSYAGSSTAGGSANSAVKLDTATAGSATQPVYFTGGQPAACTYTLGKSVPSDAVFTDTHYASSTVTSNAAGGTSTVAATSNGTVYLNHVENGGVKSSHKIVGAGATVVTSDAAGTITITSTDTNTTYGVATQSANGLMSSGDKSKLDGIQAGADAVSFTRSLTGGTKIGTLTINGTGTDLYCQTNTDTNTTYSAGAGIGLNGTQFYNTGVRAIGTGSANGTISVNTNGTAANVAVKGLGSAAYTNSDAYAAASHGHSYLPLAGGTMTGTIAYSPLAGTSGRALLSQPMADNDMFRIYVGGTDTNAGYVEIATADDGNEPIYVRQYTGDFSTVARTLTLLDGGGNSSFPGTVSAAAFAGNASSASKVANALTLQLNGSSTQTYDGSAAKTFNVTPSGIGAAAASHTHSYLPLAGGTMNGSIKFNSNSLPQKTLSFVCGIDAFNDGGQMGWMDGSNFVAQYAPTKTGGGASGNWGISINGNAATASKLATARTITINGSVTGSATFDGSGNITIGTTTNHTHDYLPTAAQQFRAVDVTTNQSNVTCPFTFTADGQNGTVMYRNTGSANVTISISTNYLSPTNEQIFFTIVPGGYGEVNYLRYSSSVIVARGL